MKKAIKNIMKKAPYFNDLNYIRFKVNYFFRTDENIIKKRYLKEFNKELNLENPRTLTEKIQYRILKDKNDRYTKLADKYLVREYVREKIGEKYLIKLLGVYKNSKEINYDLLPNRFVLKCNHDSGSVIICKDKSIFNIKEANKKLNFFLKRNFYYITREWHYKNIKPVIMCEEYLEENNQAPTDYKFHCLNNKIEFIQVDMGRFEEHKRNNFDSNWELTPFIFGSKNYNFDNKYKRIDKPKNFEKMKELALKLSEDFDYCRVDFYNIEGEIFFGEITFTPGAGIETFFPKE